MISTSRRIFIRNIFFSVSAVFFSSRAWGSHKKDKSVWFELVDYARWCPTVHNLQPHKLRIISESQAELYYDPSRLLPEEDPESIFVTVAMGVFIEHLSIAAGIYNMRIEITKIFGAIKPCNTDNTLFALINLVPNQVKEELNRELILKRRTSRLHYNNKPLALPTLRKAEKIASEFSHDFFSTTDDEVVETILKLNQQTLFEDLKNSRVREELRILFRYSEQEASIKKDGLWATCMGFSGSILKSVFTKPKWQKGILKDLLAKKYMNSFKGTKTICWFSGKFNDKNDWLHAGQMLARNWLFLTGENAYIQPFGSLITNENAYKIINELLEKRESEKKIWLIFRAGYSKTPARSFRLNTEEIIIK